MTPFIRPAGSLFSDVVLYKTFIDERERLQNRIVAFKNPYVKGEVLFARVIGT